MEKEDDSEDSSSTNTPANTEVDGGWGWMVVFGAFMINVITDGCSYSFGVLFTHLVDYFQANRSSTAWVGSVFNAAPLLFGPFASIIAKRFGFRIATIAGGLIAAIGIFASVFANSLGLLSFTYGFIAGFGISLPYLASSVVVMMYFEKRRSLATGLAECGAGIGTLIFAPLLQYFITEYGWRGSLLVLSAIVSNIVLCGALFRPQPILENSRIEISIQQDLEAVSLPTCEERTEECGNVEDGIQTIQNQCVEKELFLNPESRSLLGGSLISLSDKAKIKEQNRGACEEENDLEETESKSSNSSCRIVDTSIFRNWRFVVFLIANFILYFWYDVPYVFTVDRALEIGESKSEGALVVSSIGIVHTIGNVVFGFLGDCKRVNRSILYSVSMWLTGLGLALVPLSRNSVSFAIFDAIYGFFVAASEALSCVIVADILGMSKLSDGYGILMFLQGIANLVGPPFAGWLYDVSGSYNNTFFAAGGSIVFLGILYAVVPIHSRFTNRKIVE